MKMHEINGLRERVKELGDLVEVSERKADILTNLLKEANAEFERALNIVASSERNFRTVFEHAPEAIYIIDADTRQILDCNSFMVDWLGYSREELLTMRMDQLVCAGGRDISANVRQAMERGIVRVQERRYRKKDGTRVDAEVTGASIEYQGKRSLAILVRDVSEHRQLEELARYKELFDTVGDPVFINDYQGRFLEVNEGACTLSGYSRDQLLSRAVKDLIPMEQKARLTMSLGRLQVEEAVKFELDMITSAGDLIPFEIHARSIHYGGNPAILSVARDLSVRKKLQKTLIRTERLAAVGEMASGVAHNFNNLLQMILAAGQAAIAMLDAGRIDNCRKALDTILGSCERGANIVKRIKEFTQEDVGAAREAQVFDLCELVREAVELIQPLLKDPTGSRKYEVRVSNLEKIFVRGRPSEIYEVVVNLLRNALEAMPGGGAVEVSSSRANHQVFLKVSDEGVGIPRHNLQRIFDPFFTTKGLKSSGLGLSSSYGIVKSHGGDIQVDSSEGKGATFTVRLPEAVKEEAVQVPHEAQGEWPEINLLVVDDEAYIIKAIEMFFQDSEIRVLGASSGREGLRIYLEEKIDAVLCDLGMDEMSGWEVGQVIRDSCRERGIRKTPFVAYTGWDHGIDPEHLAEYGIDRLITKPIRMEQLLETIRELVSNPLPRSAAQ